MVYLIPSLIANEAIETIPPYVMSAVNECDVLFVENARTARRFLKKMDSSIIIDTFEWFEIHKNEEQMAERFAQCLKQQKTIGIISEAGCPGIADPGQLLVYRAQLMGAEVKPLVGPNSILLALMASGLNGQNFTFNGYLPIDSIQRIKKIRQVEEEIVKYNVTQLFIETPYRNDALLSDILKNCRNQTLLCVAVDVTSKNEWIKTLPVAEWKKQKVDLHKRPAIFLMGRHQ